MKKLKNIIRKMFFGNKIENVILGVLYLMLVGCFVMIVVTGFMGVKGDTNTVNTITTINNMNTVLRTIN